MINIQSLLLDAAGRYTRKASWLAVGGTVGLMSFVYKAPHQSRLGRDVCTNFMEEDLTTRFELPVTCQPLGQVLLLVPIGNAKHCGARSVLISDAIGKLAEEFLIHRDRDWKASKPHKNHHSRH